MNSTPNDRRGVRSTAPITDADETLKRWSRMVESSTFVDPKIYADYDVKRGLRDVSGKGVLAGLTQIGDVIGSDPTSETLEPVPGELLYRGIEITDLVEGLLADDRRGYEETCYLLLFGKLPDEYELRLFEHRMTALRPLPNDFVKDAIIQQPSRNVVNALSRSVLALYTLDEDPDDTSIPNLLRQSLNLIAKFPALAVYAYRAHANSFKDKSLVIHQPDPTLSTAENILHMLRPSQKYSELEARVLDLTLVLQAEHGGGNNSSFTTHVVSSSGTDTYATIAAALGSLKGPRHGGANIKVVQMFEELMSEVADWQDDEAIERFLLRILDKDAFDRSGLIYGMGHPVYSISDPRTAILRAQAELLAEEKGMAEEFGLYTRVERIAPEAVNKTRQVYKGVSANVDFYSGFVYNMLGIPAEMFTPLFAVSRIVGWSAHRIEEIVNHGKVIRPAYKSVAPRREYISLSDRAL